MPSCCFNASSRLSLFARSSLSGLIFAEGSSGFVLFFKVLAVVLRSMIELCFSCVASFSFCCSIKATQAIKNPPENKNAKIVSINTRFEWLISRSATVSYTHLRAHETSLHLVCRLLLGRFNKTSAAGLLFGAGILAMHFVAMSGIRLVDLSYDHFGVAISIVISLLCSLFSFKIAFKAVQPSFKNIALASIIWSGSVSLTHFCAMVATNFSIADNEDIAERLISHSNLVLMLTILAFLFSGGFLIACVTFVEQQKENETTQLKHSSIKDLSLIHI